jgi:EndoU nuclease-like protein
MHVREFAEGNREQERRPPEPAPLPLHALLALQQSAGNQAVGRVLARQKIKPQRLKGFVTSVTKTKPVPTDEEGMLLALYKKVQAGAWATSDQARDALLLARKIDQEDVTAFESAAKEPFSANTGPVNKRGAEVAARIEENAKKDLAAVERTYAKHIFDGEHDSDGLPIGYHSIAGNSKTHEAYGAKSDINSAVPGVYQQSVRDKKDKKKKKGTQSTFFPDDVSRRDILLAVANVYGANAEVRSVVYPATLKGMTFDSHEGTVYPGGGAPIGPVADPQND